jgi:hypothetical protein
VQLHDIGITPSPVPPSAPVVNPAPPSGSAARKEAKQRQAATAKSEEGASEDLKQAGGDLATGPESPHGSALTRREPLPITRHDPIRPEPSITPLRAGAHPSAWPRDVLYGAGIGLAALVFAMGFTVLRPRPRRRPPIAPAPAWLRGRSRRR